MHVYLLQAGKLEHHLPLLYILFPNELLKVQHFSLLIVLHSRDEYLHPLSTFRISRPICERIVKRLYLLLTSIQHYWISLISRRERYELFSRHYPALACSSQTAFRAERLLGQVWPSACLTVLRIGRVQRCVARLFN